MFLFWAHREILRPVLLVVCSIQYRLIGSLQLLKGTPEPFPFLVKALLLQMLVNVCIPEDVPLRAHCGLIEHDLIRPGLRQLDRILLLDTFLHVSCGITYLQQPWITTICVSINRWI